MTYLHKLPVFRHPETKARAVMFSLSGRSGYGLELYLPRKQVPFKVGMLGTKQECEAFLKQHGYTVPDKINYPKGF